MDGRAANDGQTWFWGYDNASQVGAGTIAFNSSMSPADVSSARFDKGPHPGLELSYSRSLGGRDRWSWGWSASLGWMEMQTVRDGQTLAGTLVRTTHTYPTFAPVIPPAPYAGTAAGPGPLIGDVPAETVAYAAGGAVITGSRQLEAAVYALRLGPQVELKLCPRASLTLEGGLAVALVNSDFQVSESVNIPSIGPALQAGVLATQTRAGRTSVTDGRLGGYAGLGLKVNLDPRWSLGVGGRFQSLGTHRHTVAGKTAELHLGQSLLLSLGLGCSF